MSVFNETQCDLGHRLENTVFVVTTRLVLGDALYDFRHTPDWQLSRIVRTLEDGARHRDDQRLDFLGLDVRSVSLDKKKKN